MGELLIAAAKLKDPAACAQAVERALSDGADPSFTDENGRAAIHHAAMGGAQRACEILAIHGADVSAKDSHGIEPLAFAVLSCAAPCAKLLLELGSDPNCCDVWGSPMLHLAVSGGPSREELVPYLARAGADMSKLDRHGLTALHWAAVMGKPEAAIQLVELGADPGALDAHGRAVWETCGYDDEELRGAFKNLGQEQRWTRARPLALAA